MRIAHTSPERRGGKGKEREEGEGGREKKVNTVALLVIC